MTTAVKKGTTYIDCGETLDFYDSGGPDADHGTSSMGTVDHTIVAPEGMHVRIHFESFYLGANAYLRAYNAASALGAYSEWRNTNVPPDIVSTGNVCTLRFKAASQTRFGWVAVITVDGCPELKTPIELPCGSSAVTVGGTNIEIGGSAYGSNNFTERTFYTAVGSSISINFTDLPVVAGQGGSQRILTSLLCTTDQTLLQALYWNR